MKMIKYFTRNFNLRDHYFIMQSLSKENTCIPEIYYNKIIDISKSNLITVYIDPNDKINNLRRVKKAISNNKKYISKMINKGEKAIFELSDLPVEIIKKIKIMNNEQIINTLFELRKKFLNFGGFVELTHYIGMINDTKLNTKQIKKLGNFHDRRKAVYLHYFNFWDDICEEITKKQAINNKKMGYLSFGEIIKFLRGGIDEDKINQLQTRREKAYICIFNHGRGRIINDNLNNELKKIKKLISKEKIVTGKKLRGMSINKGLVLGRVKIITQITPLKSIPANKIIVTQMTTPMMSTFLKKSKALVTDEGGLLCHAAVVARELKKPCIIGTKVATQVLRDDDLVELDADKGVVKILERK